MVNQLKRKLWTKNITSRENNCQNNSKMKTEVNSAAEFLMNLLRIRQKSLLTDSQLENFRGTLCESLTQRYQRHWYPEMPHKGSGYRCIRINGKLDPLVEEAGVAAGVNSRTLRKMLPSELTMWIDPDEVCYRIGENGSICVLYDTSRSSPSSDLDSAGSTTGSGDELIVDRVSRRIDISNDLKDLMMNFYEADTTIVTRRTNRNRHHHNHHHNNHRKQQQHYTNNTSISSNGQLSPPLSPNTQQFYNNHLHHHQQQHHYNSNTNNHHLQQFNSSPQKFNYNNYHHGNTNRTPC